MALREIAESDLEQVLKWRNSKEVRSGMYSRHEISKAEHEAWYERISNESKSRWYIHISATGTADGVVYFTEIDESSRNANWGFYTAPEAKPGSGTQLGIEALDKAFNDLELHRLNAEVIVSNDKSIAFHLKLGFTREGVSREFYFDGEQYLDVFRFGMLACDWSSHRRKFESRTTMITQPESSRSRNESIPKFYIVASSKSWHRAGFEELRAGEGKWEWASTPEELDSLLMEASPRYIFFLHWNWIVPERIYSASESVCFHMTDVPYGRGGSPLQNLILSGHKETKLSALQMSEEVDGGPVYAKKHLSLEGRAEEIYKRAGLLSIEIIRWMIREEPEPLPQSGVVTKFSRRKPYQSQLPESGTLDEIYDFIRMLDAPTYPLGFIQYGNYTFEFNHVTREEEALEARVTIRKLKPSDGERT